MNYPTYKGPRTWQVSPTRIFRNVHLKRDCRDRTQCVFHGPRHHMSAWPMVHRLTRGDYWERICRHGVGHPDPNTPKNAAWAGGVHGCDGCCQEENPHERHS